MAATTREEEKLAEELGAKWIRSPEDRPDRPGQTLATRNHDVIRAWAERRGGRPATATRGEDGTPRTLRIDFGDRTEGLEEISWDEWFRVFDDRDLVFLYQEQRADGGESNFWRLTSPHREDA